MTIYFASDHAGFSLRQTLLAHVQAAGHDVVDLGPAAESSVDYPDFGVKLATALQQDDAGYGIAICGSGIGISMALNRFSWVRAALVSDPLAAALARQHGISAASPSCLKSVKNEPFAVQALGIVIKIPYLESYELFSGRQRSCESRLDAHPNRYRF